MKAIQFLLLLPFLIAAPASGQTTAKKRLIDRIHRLHAAGYTLSGQQIGFEPWIVDQRQPGERMHEYDRVRQLTGKRPAILAIDINTGFDHPARGESLKRLARAHAAAGGIVSLSWHDAKPTQPNPDAVAPNSSYSQLTAAEWTELTTEHPTFYSWRNNHLGYAADFIRGFNDRNIPVLWRPFHEPEGNWFWWGQTTHNTPGNYRTLWQRAFQNLSASPGHTLGNIVWVYASAYPGQAPTFPGKAYVDFAGFDFYTSNPSDPLFVSRAQAATGFGVGPAALTETGRLPSSSILYPGGKRARYPWVLVWYGGDLDNTYYGAAPSGTSGNSPAQVKAFYAHPRTIDLAGIWTILERRPSLRVPGKKNITTRASSYRVKTKVGAIPITPTVEYRATRTAPRKVATKSNGTANFRVKLVRPNTTVKVRAVSSSKVRSKWVVIKIRKNT